MYGECRWYEDIHARSKADQAKAFPKAQLVPCLDAAHNTTSQDPGDLLNDDTDFTSLQRHNVLLIKARGIGTKRREKFPRLITHIHHCPRHGSAVDVHIEH